MPAKIFLQLRLLNPTFPVACFSPTKLEPQMFSSTASFSRLFPFRLKHHCLGFQCAPLRQTSRRFSTRSLRSRSELSASRAPKSLIDDEAELSDWVKDLRDDSPRGGRSDSDGDTRSRSRAGNGERRESPRSSPTSRRFEGNSRESFSGKRTERNLPTGRRFENSREERNGDSFSRNSSARFQRQGDSVSKSSSTSRRFDNKRDGQPRDFKSPRFEQAKPGLNSSTGKRGGERDMYKKRETSFKKQPRFISEDDDEDDEDDDDEIKGGDKFGIEDLLSDDDSDANEEEDEVVLPKRSAKVSATDSTGKQESYLSDTRFDQFSVSPLTLKGTKDAGFEKMTVVQEATLPVILKGTI